MYHDGMISVGITVTRKMGGKNPPVSFLQLSVFGLLMWLSFAAAIIILRSVRPLFLIFPSFIPSSTAVVKRKQWTWQWPSGCHWVLHQEDCMVSFPTFHRSMGGYFGFGCSQEVVLIGKIVKLYKSLIFWEPLA